MQEQEILSDHERDLDIDPSGLSNNVYSVGADKSQYISQSHCQNSETLKTFRVGTVNRWKHVLNARSRTASHEWLERLEIYLFIQVGSYRL